MPRCQPGGSGPLGATDKAKTLLSSHLLKRQCTSQGLHESPGACGQPSEHSLKAPFPKVGASLPAFPLLGHLLGHQSPHNS